LVILSSQWTPRTSKLLRAATNFKPLKI
jgi:hypothetical protein